MSNQEKLCIDNKKINPVTRRQAVNHLARIMAAGAGADGYPAAAEAVLDEFVRLGTIGRSNLLAWSEKPRRELSQEEVWGLLQQAATSSVYLIRNARGQFKIGKADSPEQRKIALSTGSAEELTLVHEFICPDSKALQVERVAQTSLAQQRVRGEWFACTEDEGVDAVEAAWAEAYGRPYSQS